MMLQRFALVAAILAASIATADPQPTPTFIPAADLVEAEATEALLAAHIPPTDEQDLLTPDMEAKLAERLAAILATRMQDTCEAYEELLNSWGGQHWYPAGTPKGEELRISWLAPDDPEALSTISFDQLRVEYQVNQPGDELVTLVVGGPDKSFGGSKCLFEFDPPMADIIHAGTTVCDVYFPTTRNDGTELETGFRMIWSDDHQNWLPGLILYIKPAGTSTLVLFF